MHFTVLLLFGKKCNAVCNTVGDRTASASSLRTVRNHFVAYVHETNLLAFHSFTNVENRTTFVTIVLASRDTNKPNVVYFLSNYRVSFSRHVSR